MTLIKEFFEENLNFYGWKILKDSKQMLQKSYQSLTNIKLIQLELKWP